MEMKIEDLLGISMDSSKQEITLYVVSSGCTERGDFKFDMKNGAPTIIRLKKDTCKAIQSEVMITYSLQETGIDPNKPFMIKNQFVASRFIANIR